MKYKIRCENCKSEMDIIISNPTGIILCDTCMLGMELDEISNEIGEKTMKNFYGDIFHPWNPRRRYK